jgi:hypothetical protein
MHPHGPSLRLTLLLLTTSAFLPVTAASAQRGLDRALTTSRAARPVPEETVETPRGPLLAQEPAKDTVMDASWLLQPLGTVSGSDYDLGLLGGLKNTDRYGSWSWQLTVRGLHRYQDGTAHTHLQADGELYPPVRKPFAVGVYVMVANTIDLGWSEQVALELDVGSEIGSGWEVGFGVIGYYGWTFPRDGESSHGAILGLAGYGERGRIKLSAEYDLSSDFLGEDSYSLAGSLRLTPLSANPELSVRGGWEKGDIFSLRLQLGVLHNKPRPARLSIRQGSAR